MSEILEQPKQSNPSSDVQSAVRLSDLATCESLASEATAPVQTQNLTADAATSWRPEQDAVLHFGQVLAAKRQSMGLSQTEIAARLRLHIRQVVALEAADFPALPELAFIRGYLRNYARTLGLDEQALLEDLHQRVQTHAVAQMEGEAVEDRAWMSTAREGALTLAKEWLVSRRVLVALVLGVLLVFAVVGVVASRKSAQVSEVAHAVTDATLAVDAAPPFAVVESGPSTFETDALTREAGLAVMQVPAITDMQWTPPQGPTTLRLTFRERSWAEVAQGDGRIVLSQVIEPGSARQFSGQPPYRVLIGRASTVTVQWRGRAVDLKPHTNFENVARLTLE